MLVGSPKAFSQECEWGNIPLCDHGDPNRVNQSTFKLSGVPSGTKKLAFNLEDLDADYDHEGETIAYNGQNSIPAGVVDYLSPCPPDGNHDYQWTVRALGSGGKELGKAKAKRSYPK